MKRELKILCFHGLGGQSASGWQSVWSTTIKSIFAADPVIGFDLAFPSYDPIFEKTDLSSRETFVALWKLAQSGLPGIGRRDRSVVSDVSEQVRWTAGYVVAWIEDEAFQTATRKFVLDQIRAEKPDAILAHSLGSLITYNAFSHPDASEDEVASLIARAQYVTFGSQIANPFVVGNLTFGRVQPLPVKFWTHLFNVHDDVFTTRIEMPGVRNFCQLLTPFDFAGMSDHAADGYLGHRETIQSFWLPFADEAEKSRPVRRSLAKELAADARDPQKRALLVGINEYPNEKDRLEGCVNDVFTMSAVLQECGFAPDNIRACLDKRATAAGILERMRWLCDDARDGDELVFFYSGHGARVPEYGEFMEPDRLTETLVPWDFDWTPETSISDEQIYSLYAQLPYGVRFLMIFDCCHSGGMHRQSGAKARGISPPDDIRHRELKWDLQSEMWVDRDFKPLNREFSSNQKAQGAFFGENGATVRLGRASNLRRKSKKAYDGQRKKDGRPVGPFLPLIVEACGEEQLSYEYRHGATSYGAFTFCLASILRKSGGLSFDDLAKQTARQLADLGYLQTPQILGPTEIRQSKVPFLNARQRSKSVDSDVPGINTPRTSG